MTIDTHLGRSADGTKNAPYVQPKKIDRELLVRVPRSENRIMYGLEEGKLPFVGHDVWHAHEFSYLNILNQPVQRKLKICYPSKSKYIVESKSLKLYLNSYAFVHLNSPAYQVEQDLTRLLETKVNTCVFDTTSSTLTDKFLGFKELTIGSEPYNQEDFVKENPSFLEKHQEHPWGAYHSFSSAKFSCLRSNCKITNQPDWGTAFIHYTGPNSIKETGLAKYLTSFRNENHFHEECCEMIYKRLWDIFEPEELFVACLYTRRGGIDINPVRASNPTLLRNLAPTYCEASFLNTKMFNQ